MKGRDRFVDQLLDSALLHHRAEEPRSGFEARLLGRVRAATEESAAGKAWKLWIAAAAIAVVVMMFVAIRVANRSHSPVVEASQAANVIPSTSPRQILAANAGAGPKAGNATSIVEPKRTAYRERKPSRQVEAHHWPSRFPTPAPLNAEEKALVRYVLETPPQVLAEPILKAELTVQHVEIKPLEIPQLEIKPLAPGSGREEMQ